MLSPDDHRHQLMTCFFTKEFVPPPFTNSRTHKPIIYETLRQSEFLRIWAEVVVGQQAVFNDIFKMAKYSNRVFTVIFCRPSTFFGNWHYIQIGGLLCC